MKKFPNSRDERDLHRPSIHVSQCSGALSHALPFWSEPGIKHCTALAAYIVRGHALCLQTCKGMPTGLRSGVWCGEPPALLGAASSPTVPAPRCTLPHPSSWRAKLTSRDAAQSWYSSAAIVGSLPGAGLDPCTGTSELWDLQHSTEPLHIDVLTTSVSKSTVPLPNTAWERHLLFKCVIADERNWNTKTKHFPFS